MLHKESSYTPPTTHLQKRKLMSGGGGEKGSSMGGLIWTSAGETPPRIGGGKRSRVVSVDRESKEYTQTVQTKLTASVELDKEVVRKLMMEEGRETSLVVAQNNEVLRRYFLRMTESFLIPLERYFSSLMPLVKTISPFFPPPRLKEFNEEEFLEGFLGKERVASKEFVIKRDKERELYRAFIRSPNFRGWFRSRKMEAVGRLRAIYLDTVLEADLPSMLKGRSDVEMVDMYLRLLTVLKKKYVPDTSRPQLQEQLHSIVSLLPEDLRDSVAQNFERHKPDEKGVSVG